MNIEVNPGPHRKPKSHKARTPRNQHLAAREQLQIRRALKKPGASYQSVAKKFNVKPHAVKVAATKTPMHPSNPKFPTTDKDNIPPPPPTTRKRRAPSPEKPPQLSPFEKGHVAEALEQKQAKRTIARARHRDPATIRYWDKRAKKDGWERKTNPGSGRPRVTSERTDREIKRRIMSKSKETVSKLTRELTQTLGDAAPSRKTVERRAHEAPVRCYRLIEKPLLTDRSKEARYDWAQAHLNWTQHQWEHVLWSDESPMSLWMDDSGGIVWLPLDHDLKDQLTPKVAHGGGGFSIWGCFSYHGVGPLVRVKGAMNGKWYHDTILTKHAIPHIETLIRNQHKKAPKRDRVWYFQHDNAPPHRTADNKRYLNSKMAEWQPKLKTLMWPSNSPDLNPLENIWSYIKQQLNAYEERPSNLDELWKRIQTIWENIPLKQLQTLAHSMPKRVREVIDNEGWSIMY